MIIKFRWTHVGHDSFMDMGIVADAKVTKADNSTAFFWEVTRYADGYSEVEGNGYQPDAQAAQDMCEYVISGMFNQAPEED